MPEVVTTKEGNEVNMGTDAEACSPLSCPGSTQADSHTFPPDPRTYKHLLQAT